MLVLLLATDAPEATASLAPIVVARPKPRRLGLATILLLLMAPILVAPADALPPGTSITFSSSPTTHWHQSQGTTQGVATDGSLLYLTTSSTISAHTTTGTVQCQRSTTNDGSGGTNGAPAIHNGVLHVPRKTGNDATAATNVAHYSTSCQYLGQTNLGNGIVEALTYHRGHFYAAARNDETSLAYVRLYTENWGVVLTFVLGNYDQAGSFAGPNGIAFLGDHLLMPLHASNGASNGIEVWRFPHEGEPVHVTTLSYPTWTSNGRTEVASQGIHIVDHYEDGASSPYAWVVGRDGATGNGFGSGSVARFDLNVNEGTYSWISPPVTYQGSPQVLRDVDDQHLQGIAINQDHVYVIQSFEIEKWTHDGTFVSRRATSNDLPNLRLGGGTIHGDHLYISGSDYPSVPRSSWILKYRLTDLALLQHQATQSGAGEGGGVGYHDGSIVYLKDRDLVGDVWLQRYHPDTLAFQSQTYLGYYHGIFHQGIEVLQSGSTAYIIAPHHDPQDPYGKPGLHQWRTTDGSTWSYQGTSAYTTWNNPFDSGGRLEANSQDIEYGCLGSSKYVWSVGRRAEDGGGFGSWVRHAVHDPNGYIQCDSQANLAISSNVHTSTGSASGTAWSFTAQPGAQDVASTTFLKVTNTGNAAGSVRVDLGGSFTGAGTISTSNNIVYQYGTGSNPGNVAMWQSQNGGTGAVADFSVPAGSTLWIQYKINALPAILRDGSYTTSLTITQI